MKAESSPSVDEAGFIKLLESRAVEQQMIVQTELIPDWARGLGGWLAVNPWRMLVPIAAILYVLLRLVVGLGYRDFILGLFGGFGV